jgi:hypothetical protein
MDKKIIDKDIIMSVYAERGIRGVRELYKAEVIITVDELSTDIDDMIENGSSSYEIEELISKQFN